MTEELFKISGEETEIAKTPWPEYDETKTIDEEIKVPVQINGKLKSIVNVSKDITEEDIKQVVHKDEAIQRATEGKNVVKEIYVKGKIYNIVVK